MPTVSRGRVDEPDPAVGPPQQVATPQVAVQPGRWFRWSGDLDDALTHAIDIVALVQRQRVHVGQDALLDVERRPVRAFVVR